MVPLVLTHGHVVGLSAGPTKIQLLSAEVPRNAAALAAHFPARQEDLSAEGVKRYLLFLGASNPLKKGTKQSMNVIYIYIYVYIFIIHINILPSKWESEVATL